MCVCVCVCVCVCARKSREIIMDSKAKQTTKNPPTYQPTDTNLQAKRKQYLNHTNNADLFLNVQRTNASTQTKMQTTE